MTVRRIVPDVHGSEPGASREFYVDVLGLHPLTDEPWGVRRFFVRDPNGSVLNILSHTVSAEG